MESTASSAGEGTFYVYLQKCIFNGVKCPVFHHIPWGGGNLSIIALNSGKINCLKIKGRISKRFPLLQRT